jgi:hypothetical protein
MRVEAQLSETLGGEYIVKAATKGEILIPRTLHKGGGDNPVLCLINLSDHHVELEKGEGLAYAEEVCSKVEPVDSNGLHLRTHLFCIGQHFPLFQFYMVIG